jgi:peptide/nickel transport system substrate-binding protein
MHKRLWLLAAVAIASLLVAGGAAATATVAASASASKASASSAVPADLKGLMTPAARRAKNTLVFGAEQDVDGFNTSLNCCAEYWAVVTGNSPTLRGAYEILPNGNYKFDQISGIKVHFGSRPYYITYFIKKSAHWSDGKPVSGADFVYTWKQIINPNNDVTSRDGYDQITSAKVSNKGKTVRLNFKAPYADYRDLFITGGLYPAHVLKGEDFNKIWSNCVCNPKTGTPISNGPFLLQSYHKGSDVVLVRNPKGWAGPRAKLSKVIFRFIQDTNSEIQAMRGGEVDAIAPSPQTNLTTLQNQRGIRYSSIPGLYLEHIDLSGNGSHNKLMEQQWFRQALILGIDRRAPVKTFYGQIAPGLGVQNSLVFYQSDGRYVGHFKKWTLGSYSAQVAKAKQLLSSHGCRAGSGGILSCNGTRAELTYMTTGTNKRRVLSAQVYKDEFKALGIDLNLKLVPPNVMFGPQGISSGNFDMAEYAWVTSPDPAFAVPWLKCKGGSNYMTFCNAKVSRLLNQSDVTTSVTKRAKLFNQADSLMSTSVPVIPLYAQPSILVYKTSVKGMINNPSVLGPSWNIWAWHF